MYSNQNIFQTSIPQGLANIVFIELENVKFLGLGATTNIHYFTVEYFPKGLPMMNHILVLSLSLETVVNLSAFANSDGAEVANFTIRSHGVGKNIYLG